MAFGLVGLLVSLLLLADLLLGVIADPVQAQRQLRRGTAETLAIQLAALVEAGDTKTLGTTLKEIVRRNHDVRSAAVRPLEGATIAQGGDHARHWRAADDAAAANDQISVPLRGAAGPWGAIEVAFVPSQPNDWKAWLKQPMVLLLFVLPIAAFGLFYAYLRRALQYLDPSAVVPDRVRKAFNALTDAVLVLDPDGKVMLANSSFRCLHPEADTVLHGRRVDELQWLWPPGAAEPAPWTRTLQDGSSVQGQALTVEQPDGTPLHAVVGCAAILDAGGRARGCLVTIDDVTQVHRSNDELRRTLVELENSREQIKAQNAELHQLATRDPLTACLNRRALFEQAAAVFAAAPGEGLCCIMVDIDHFKRFNDQFGHSVGDEVIKVVARTLGRGLRASDVLGRYGGEEFCILMPNTSIVIANDVAQRLRIAIMTHAASSTRLPDLPAITSSFGLASTSQGAGDLQQLIERADAALYKSKQAGRNRVTLWRPDIATVAATARA